MNSGATDRVDGLTWPDPRIAAVIPAYRPPPGLDRIVAALAATGCPLIVVVDDGSGDSYAKAFAAAAETPGTRLVRHPVNLGKGAALRTGFAEALNSDPGLRGVVTLDADGQHLPADCVRVCAALSGDPEALVLGVREMQPGAPWRSRFGNNVTRTLFRALHATPISDTQTGLRGIPASFLPDLLAIPSQRYEFELDMLVAAAATRAIREVAIATVYLDGNRSSHFDPVFDSLRIYFSLFRFGVSAFCAFVLDFIVFYAALLASGNIALSLLIGRVLATTTNYLINRRFVFRYREKALAPLVKYLLLVAVIALLSYSVILVLVPTLGITAVTAKLIAEGGLFVFSYLAQRTIVFARKDNG